MPCMPHFHDHYIPSTWVILRQQDPTPAAPAAPPADIESARQETETKLRAEFKQVIQGIIRILMPFREAYEAVCAFVNEKAAEELQARQQPQPRTV